MFDERRNQHRADGKGGGNRGAGNGTKNHAGQHAGHGQATLHTAHNALGKFNQTTRNATGFHDVAGQDEEGDGGQGKFVDRVEHFLDGNQHVGVAGLNAQNGCQTDGDGDRDGECKAQHHGREHDDGHCAVSSSRRCGSIRLPMMPMMEKTPPTGSAR